MLLKSITASSPHIHLPNTVAMMMRRVIYALMPGIALSCYYFGLGILIHCVLAIVFALLTEALVLKLNGAAIKPALTDGSAVVTALLFALCISPYTPWWVSFIGISFAIIVVKHAFGGLGQNVFNPAMAAYVFVLLCFPLQTAFWPELATTMTTAPLSTQLQLIMGTFSGDLDAISGATPLAHMQLELGLRNTVAEIQSHPLYGNIGGRGWEWIALAYLAGGIWLLVNKTIHWQIPLSVLASLIVLSLFFHMVDSDLYPAASYHLCSGGAMLCAFFVATDPTSSATTPKGKIIYGIGIGSLIYIIRTWGAYPDGVAFAIVIMNALVPLIDHYTRPKALGEK